jgi:HNH endonuclease
MQPKVEEAYVYDLHLLAGGYSYYSTISLWENKMTEHGRDYRAPSPTIVRNFEKALTALGQRALPIRTRIDYEHWLLRRGWAIVPVAVAWEVMPQWLKGHQCVAGALGCYTAIDLVARGVTDQSANRKKKEIVKERDGCRCLLCERTERDGIKLTMHHVRPFSHGGETTTSNLVALCEECNQRVGSQHLEELYQLAGLPHCFDLGLLKAEVTSQAIYFAMMITKNLMYARCIVY